MRCAGPNSSPRKLCAIITWSRTPTLYMLASVVDPATQLGQRARAQPAHDRRQLVKAAAVVDQSLEPRVAAQLEREREPAPRRPARALSRWQRADLRRAQREPQRMKALAERELDRGVA